jgi:8-oxo-dGTP pyrophosphatase MutT (NUDIX family)
MSTQNKKGIPVHSGLDLTFTIDDARLRCSRVVMQDLPPDVFAAPIFPPQGDHALNPDLSAAPVKAKPAAVLIPIVARPEGPTMLLTERASKLRNHAGQVAFPGGRVDAADGSPTITALREAEEEIGLMRDYVEALGYLSPYQTGTGYRVVPVVGIVQPGFDLVLNPHEVVDAFEVPLDFLFNEASYRRHRWEREGVIRESWALDFRDKLIWGVTAGILRNFYEGAFR